MLNPAGFMEAQMCEESSPSDPEADQEAPGQPDTADQEYDQGRNPEYIFYVVHHRISYPS